MGNCASAKYSQATSGCKAGGSQHQANISVSSNQSDRKGAGAPDPQKHQGGEREHAERQRKGQTGEPDDQQRIGAKMVDDAVHGRDCEHRHGEHAQAIDALVLCLDERLSGQAADDGRSQSTTPMIRKSLRPNASGEASAVPR